MQRPAAIQISITTGPVHTRKASGTGIGSQGNRITSDQMAAVLARLSLATRESSASADAMASASSQSGASSPIRRPPPRPSPRANQRTTKSRHLQGVPSGSLLPTHAARPQHTNRTSDYLLFETRRLVALSSGTDYRHHDGISAARVPAVPGIAAARTGCARLRQQTAAFAYGRALAARTRPGRETA